MHTGATDQVTRLARGALVAVLLAGAGCAAAILLPANVEEYPRAHVRIYHGAAGRCRVELVTATETIQTAAARCHRVPHRVMP